MLSESMNEGPDKDYNMPSFAPRANLSIVSGLLLAAGTPALGRLLLTLLGRLASALGCRLLSGLAAGAPALGGGLLGATLLGCHADKDSCEMIQKW